MKVKTLYLIIPIVFGGMTLVLHGYLGYFSRYIGDDYCTAFYAHRLGVFRSTWFWYLNWSGRYSASVADAAIGLLGPRAIPAIVPLTIIVWLAILTAFFLIFLSSLRYKFLISLALAVTTLFALFLLAPDIRQSLYWGQGMRSVVPPLMMGTAYIILFKWIRARAWTRLHLLAWAVISFLWSLIAGGFSETYASFQVTAFVASLFVILMIEKSRFSSSLLFLTSGLLGAISSLIIIILAPGNAERQAFFPPPPGVGELLTISLNGFLAYGASLVSSPEKFLVIVSLCSLAVIIGSKLNRDIHTGFLAVIPSLMIGFMFTCFLPAAYGTSESPPGRTLMLPTYFFLIGLFAWGLVCGTLVGERQNAVVLKWLPGAVIVTLFIAASLHSIDLYQSRFEFIEYATAWDQTNTEILKSRQNGATQVVIPVIPSWTSIETPNDNPRFWVNRCMSAYYDLQILAAPESPSPAP
ncbi:MAG TPA: DUF6056 family protein [Anaerolineales bacterium]|nr:DUF6056 family protein [Anaerolineales bacterium]